VDVGVLLHAMVPYMNCGNSDDAEEGLGETMVNLVRTTIACLEDTFVDSMVIVMVTIMMRK